MRPLVLPDSSFVVGKEVIDGEFEVVRLEVFPVGHLPHELSRLGKVNLDAMERLLLPEGILRDVLDNFLYHLVFILRLVLVLILILLPILRIQNLFQGLFGCVATIVGIVPVLVVLVVIIIVRLADEIVDNVESIHDFFHVLVVSA